MNIQQQRKQRTIEFIGWMVAILLLLFGASYLTVNKQVDSEDNLDEFNKINAAQKNLLEVDNSINTAFKKIDKHLEDYLKRTILTSAKLEDSVSVQVKIIESKIASLAPFVDENNVEKDYRILSLFSKVIEKSASNYRLSLTDKKEKLNYLVSDIACKVLKPKCGETSVGDNCCGDLQRLKRSVGTIATRIRDNTGHSADISRIKEVLYQGNDNRVNDNEKIAIVNRINAITNTLTGQLNNINGEANRLQDEVNRY